MKANDKIEFSIIMNKTKSLSRRYIYSQNVLNVYNAYTAIPSNVTWRYIPWLYTIPWLCKCESCEFWVALFELRNLRCIRFYI